MYEVAVISVPDNFGSNLIVATVTLNANQHTSSSELLKLAKSQLPPYAVPSEIVLVESMPHTSSGKINRRELRENWESLSSATRVDGGE